MISGRAGRRLRTTLFTLGLAVVVALLLGKALMALDPLGLGGVIDPVVDDSGYDAARRRLAVVAADLDAVEPRGAQAMHRAVRAGCSRDSGQMFEPAASRVWSFTDGAAGAGSTLADLADQLRERGWSTDGPTDDFLDLDKRIDGTRVGLGVQSLDGSIVAETCRNGPRVCRGSSSG